MADYKPYYDKSYALVVGIDSYTDRSFVPLGEAEADAQKFAALLESPAFGFEVRTLLGEAATREAVLEALFALQQAGPDDRLLVYIAGHGYTLVDRFGAETGYLACVDTESEKHYTALELEEITDLRRRSEAKHIAFIFDACFSGQALGLTRGVTERDTSAAALLERRAYQVLSAGAGDQTVSDFHSMTDVIVERLAQEGVSTLNSLGLYVQQRMATESKQLQIPQFGHLTGSQGGDFIFEAEIDAEALHRIDDTAPFRPAPVRGGLPSWVLGGIIGAVLSVVLIFGLILLVPEPDPVPPPDSGPEVVYTDEDAQRVLVPQVQEAVLLYDREFRYALETGEPGYIGLAATGEALQDRLNALEILQAAGDCYWDYDQHDFTFRRIEFFDDDDVEVRALVDRDGRVYCGREDPVARPEFDFEGPLLIRYRVIVEDQRWKVSVSETLDE
ncbi:MAG: caspase family protein [Chloroflexi bacterium]|nr:caspase family protein [Chloroflexota bacterium]